jgi:hypothetical protein
MSSLLPIPVSRYLVPDSPVTIPDGFTPVDQTLSTGLPFTLPLFRDLSLTLTVPTGLAAEWRDADGSAIVSQSDDQLGPRTAPASVSTVGGVERAPARFLLLQSGAVLASIPLVAGMQHLLPDGGGVAIELVVVSWSIRAGNVRGAGDFGSRIRFGWREADQAVDQFTPPAVNPHILSRLKDPFGILPLWYAQWLQEWEWIQTGYSGGGWNA